MTNILNSTPSQIRPSSKSVRGPVELSLAVAALVVSALFQMPFLPSMPAIGLDASWGYALNEAVVRHLVFGRDLIFTFGPLGSAYAQMYHPGTDGIMLMGSAVLSIALCAGFAILAIPRRPLALLLLPIVLATAQNHDATFVAIPFCMLFASFVLTRPNEAGVFQKLPRIVVATFIFISAACGMLPLVKGSFVAVTLFLLGCTTVLIARSRHTKLAVAIPVVALFSMLACWVGLGQPVTMLLKFFIAQMPIILGYAGAMSSEGSYWVVGIWLLTALVSLAVVWFSLSRGQGADGLLFWIGVFVYLFITFKASFVRQDSGHLYTALASMIFLSLMFIMSVRLQIALAYTVLAIAVWGTIEILTNSFHPTETLTLTWRTFERTVAGLNSRLASPSQMRIEFQQANASIRAAFPIENVKGTVDIYPTELAPIFAYDLDWSGRPVPQSYSAYTPGLDIRNAEHLLQANAPRTVFYTTSSIDGRLPSLEDASSLPILLTQYHIVGKRLSVLQLSRSTVPVDVVFKKLDEREVEVNKEIDVPSSRDPVVAKIVMKQTFLGKIVAAAFKLPPVYIETTFKDGVVRRNRFIPGMAGNGFIASPYVGTTDDVVDIAAGVSMMQVKGIRIITPEDGFWRKNMQVEFSSFAVNSQDTATALAGVNAKSAYPPTYREVSASPAQCYFESVNGMSNASFSAGIPETGNTVTVVGWASPSTATGSSPDEIWLVLESADGLKNFYKTQMVERQDVAAAFDHPDMTKVGFKVKIREAAAGLKSMSVLTARDGVVQDCGIKQQVMFKP
ncbi:hypothetical protein PQQ87_37920 [Paraburkholderia nemoris]|uniref:hypothetical protein n=1 Tax=Paraburkholderia nemoris TaxID=2793076 RepID=UPI0038B8F365